MQLFDYEPLGEGWVISQYNGFDEPEIKIPDHYQGKPVLAIDESVFKNARDIQAVYLPDSLYYIEMSAFRNCSNLKKVTFSKNLRYIGMSAFANTAIEELDIPDSTIEIGNYAFEDTPVRNVHYSRSMTKIPNGCFSACTQLKEFVLPDGIQSIGYAAFEECTSLESISLNYGLKTIESGSFTNCIKLNEIHIPPTLEEMGNAFQIGRLKRTETYKKYKGLKANPNITLFCAPGSCVQKYARNEGIKMQRDTFVYTKPQGSIREYIFLSFNEPPARRLKGNAKDKVYQYLKTRTPNVYLVPGFDSFILENVLSQEEKREILEFVQTIGRQYCQTIQMYTREFYVYVD